MFETTPLQVGIPGGPELLIVLVLAILLFGASKIPKLARSSGQAIGEFQKGREQVEQELDDMRDATGMDDEDESDGLIDTEPVTSDSSSSGDSGSSGGGGGE
jgi:sec-independent protein translocase protein TatA